MIVTAKLLVGNTILITDMNTLTKSSMTLTSPAVTMIKNRLYFIPIEPYVENTEDAIIIPLCDPYIVVHRILGSLALVYPLVSGVSLKHQDKVAKVVYVEDLAGAGSKTSTDVS